MKALISQFVGRVFVLLRSLGPYAAIELLLPGGSVLALLYWWHRHRARQVHVSLAGDTPRVGQPSSESAVRNAVSSLRNAVFSLRQAVSRIGVRLHVCHRAAPARSQGTPLSPCRAIPA